MAIELSGLVQDLPKILTNKQVTPELMKLREVFWGAFAYSFFKQVHKDFKMRSKGGSDSRQQTWKPIKASTKAYRPRKTNNKGRGLLTKAQDSEWKRIFVRYFKKFSATMAESRAKAEAAKIAWAVLKKQGAKTKIDVYGSKDALIMIRTGRLRDSLKPGKFDGKEYTPSGPDQIYNFRRGKIKLGTSVPYAGEVDDTRSVFGDEDAIIKDALGEGIKALGKEMKRL